MGGVCRWCLTLLATREDGNQVSETFTLVLSPLGGVTLSSFFFKAQNVDFGVWDKLSSRSRARFP